MEEKDREKIKAKRERETKQLLSDIRLMLNRPEGLRFIWFILGLTGIFDEGIPSERRDVGVRLIKKLNKADADAVVKVLSLKNKGD